MDEDTGVFLLTDENFVAWKKRLIQLNEKLVKKGYPEVHIKEHTTYFERGSHGMIHWNKITIDSPKMVGRNCTYVGTISFVEGVKQIFTAPGSTVVLGSIPDESLTCDHCRIKRQRNKYSFFIENDRLVCIGSSCAKDYFGWNIEHFLDTYQYLMDYLDELQKDSEGSGHYSRSIAISDLIICTYLATDKWMKPWISKDRAMPELGRPSTGGAVQYWVYPPRGEFGKDIWAARQVVWNTIGEDLVQEAISKIMSTYGEMEPKNDFEWNIKNNLFYGDGTLRDLVVSIGVTAYAIYTVMHPQVESIKKESNHVGNPGDKINLKVTALNIKKLDTMYGVSYLVLMQDEEGNIFKTFSTSASVLEVTPGNKYDIKGTIKGHEVYQGTKQTNLTRVKFAEIK